jgi:hypothetical protein
VSTFLRYGVLGALLLGSAAPAQAQGGRPPTLHIFRGLFGPTESEQQLNRRLFLSMSIYGSTDDNTAFATGGEIGDEGLQRGRIYQGAQAQLSFKRQRPRSLLTLSGSSGLRYYADLHDVTTTQHGGTIATELTHSPRFRVQLAGSARYAPNYQVQVGPAPPIGTLPSQPGDDASVGRQKLIEYGGGVSFVLTPDRVTEWLFAAGGGYSQFIDAPDFGSRSARVRYTRRLSRDFSLRLGYGDGDAGRSDGTRTRMQDIDLGVNYNRGLVLSPRTSLGFSSGSAIVSASGERKFTLVGSAFVKHQLSPRWSLQTNVNRSLQSIPTAPRPFVTDAVDVSFAGYLTRRTSMRLTPACSRGVDAVDPSARFTSCASNARFEFALNRFWAVYGEHFYYRYNFSPGTDLSTGVPRQIRQGARAGLTLWAPMIR